MMRDRWSYFWWGAAGATLGGVSSAVLAAYTILAPIQHLPGLMGLNTRWGTPAHGLEITLTGMLMGAASGVCLARYLRVRPATRKNLVAWGLAALLLAGLLGQSGLLDEMRQPFEVERVRWEHVEEARLEQGRAEQARLDTEEEKRDGLRLAAQPRAGLTGAWLLEADLRGAKLAGRRLVGACLEGADLRGVDLRGANLSGALLDSAKLAGARYDSHTQWPDDFDPQRHGAVMLR